MSIERILRTPALMQEIAQRLERAPQSDGRRQALPPDKVRALSDSAAAGKESVLSRVEEAIIRREGRPAMFVRNGRIDGAGEGFWAARLDDAARGRLELAIPSVGRIDLHRHPRRRWVGTGWMVAPDVLVTNRHVAREFATARAGEFVFDEEPFNQPVEVSVDFVHEHEVEGRRVFRIVRVLHVEDPTGPDVALLKVVERGADGEARPTCISLAETDPDEGTVVGVVGYPAWDGERNAAEVMEPLFQGIYDVKRFLPGEVMARKTRYLTHDASTLGGNSGSVVLDFATGRAVGLHYAGYYEDENFAVKASTLSEILHKLKITTSGTAPMPGAEMPSPSPIPTTTTTTTPAPSLAAPSFRVEAATLPAIDRMLGGGAVESAPVVAAAAGSGELTPEQTRDLIKLVGKAMDRLRDDHADASDLGASPEDEVAARLQSWLRENASQRALLQNLDGEVKFDERDLRWGLSLLNWLRGIKKHAPERPKGGPEPLPANARVAIVGDWGSGLYGAPRVGQTVGSGGYQLAVHLGDVYYAGTEKEVRENFLRHWPTKVPGLVSRALNSNHEMYSGGYGYFDLTLPALGQTGSTFAACNDHFLLVGLDTGYEEHDLDGEQVIWLRDLVANAGARKVILMSHHQLYSAGKPPVEKLRAWLSDLLEARRIFAWYWGHEHEAVIFEPHPTWGLYTRCIGHGGFPYFRHKGDEPVEIGREGARWRRLAAAGQTPAAMLLDDPNPFVKADGADPEKYGAQGFASLEIAGPTLIERLHRPEGTVIYEKKLS